MTPVLTTNTTKAAANYRSATTCCGSQCPGCALIGCCAGFYQLRRPGRSSPCNFYGDLFFSLSLHRPSPKEEKIPLLSHLSSLSSPQSSPPPPPSIHLETSYTTILLQFGWFDWGVLTFFLFSLFSSPIFSHLVLISPLIHNALVSLLPRGKFFVPFEGESHLKIWETRKRRMEKKKMKREDDILYARENFYTDVLVIASPRYLFRSCSRLQSPQCHSPEMELDRGWRGEGQGPGYRYWPWYVLHRSYLEDLSKKKLVTNRWIGTTNSAVAVMEGKTPKIIENMEGRWNKRRISYEKFNEIRVANGLI